MKSQLSRDTPSFITSEQRLRLIESLRDADTAVGEARHLPSHCVADPSS